MVALFVVLTIITFLTIDYLVQRAEAKRVRSRALAPAPAAPAMAMAAAPALAVAPPLESMPRGLFLDRGHTWAEVDPSGSLRIGADLLSATLLGQAEAVELPAAGSRIARGAPIARLRRGGRELVLRSPADGVIEAINGELASDPAHVARDPFGAGWLVRLAPERLGAAIQSMLVGDEALAWLRDEIRQLRAAIASLADRSLADRSLADRSLVGATLQDGGLPVAGIADQLDADDWAQVAVTFFGSWRQQQ